MSRGLSLGDLMDYKSVIPAAPVVVKTPVQTFPNQYALFIQEGLYYTSKRLHPWSSDVQDAELWIDKAAPDSIVEHWNKESKDKFKDSAIIGGFKMKDNVRVVDVTKTLKLYIIKIGGIYYFTGHDWTTKVSEALAYRKKSTVEYIMEANKMSGYSTIIELDLDRASFL